MSDAGPSTFVCALSRRPNVRTGPGSGAWYPFQGPTLRRVAASDRKAPGTTDRHECQGLSSSPPVPVSARLTSPRVASLGSARARTDQAPILPHVGFLSYYGRFSRNLVRTLDSFVMTIVTTGGDRRLEASANCQPGKHGQKLKCVNRTGYF